MTPASKAARKIRHATLKTITKNLGYSYLGFRLTPAQLRAGARTLYDGFTHKNVPDGHLFHWEANALNTPREVEHV